MYDLEDPSRQLGSNLSEISAHHLTRYYFAASLLDQKTRVLDIGCGCGYGTWILWTITGMAAGIDLSPKAIAWADKYYKGPLFLCSDGGSLDEEADIAVVFEVIEHIPDPKKMLEGLKVKRLIASVPNEEKYPFKADNFKDDSSPHLRHYTPVEFEKLLNDAGFDVVGKFCQIDKLQTGIKSGTEGKFLIYMGVKGNAQNDPLLP